MAAYAESNDVSGSALGDTALDNGRTHVAAAKREFTDPVYKKLSKINGQINKMTRPELQRTLKELDLDPRGVKEVLKKRLKNYQKRKKLMKAQIRPPSVKKFDYFAVIDFEATCEENVQDYQHEIIEFPIVLVDLDKCQIVDKFQEYVKPVINPKLSTFCTKLTGIKQEKVDKARHFPEVLDRVSQWLKDLELGDRFSFAVLTDGPWDMYRFMYSQCVLSQIPMPKWSKRWINVRKAYCNFYQCRRGGIEVMLENLGMRFEGSPHCGLDDATNIARIAIQMLQDGCALTVNEYIDVRFDLETSEMVVRFEAAHEESGDGVDEEDSSERRKKQTRSSKRSPTSVAEITNDLQNVSLQSTTEQQEEDIDDLISYFRNQSR